MTIKERCYLREALEDWRELCATRYKLTSSERLTLRISHDRVIWGGKP